MTRRFAAAAQAEAAPARVLAAFDIAAAVMLETPEVSRAVMGALGAPTQEPGEVRTSSQALWAMAVAEGEGFEPGLLDLVLNVLPDLLAIAFRGVLSFWSAGEITDETLPLRARATAAATMFGFAKQDMRAELVALLHAAA